MNILDTIIAKKVGEVKDCKSRVPVRMLESSSLFSRKTYSLCKVLQQESASGIIAEFKRKSPSQGIINDSVSIGEITTGYFRAGASALSVLTDHDFFGGTAEDLKTARDLNSCPILRKDFIVDEYQVIEAKSIGADVVLLIAAVLKPVEIKNLTSFARSLDLEVLLEVHNEEELVQNLESNAHIIGVNNRNLKTFEVSIDTSRHLSEKIPSHFIKISESGIDAPDIIHELRDFGYRGFLMGQNFMKHKHPDKACFDFIQQLKLKA